METVFLRNVGMNLQVHTALQPTRSTSTCQIQTSSSKIGYISFTFALQNKYGILYRVKEKILKRDVGRAVFGVVMNISKALAS
jgi:hypothetical protein